MKKEYRKNVHERRFKGCFECPLREECFGFADSIRELNFGDELLDALFSGFEDDGE